MSVNHVTNQPDLFGSPSSTAGDLAFENSFWERGIERISGTDEAGRGCLAGPVVAAAVILKPGIRIEGVTDSKALSAAKRNELAEQIRAESLAWCVAECSPAEIDQMNILWAAMEAMRRAVAGLTPQPEQVLIDGNTEIPGLDVPSRTIIKGDARSHSIAAASILAKTHRDALMLRLHDDHPGFGWDTNMGYPTAAHYQGLATHGPTSWHRTSFNLQR